MEKHYEVTLRTVLLALAVLAGVWLLIKIFTVLAALFIALILSLALDPFVTKLKSWKVPRPLGVFLVFFLLLLVSGSLITYGFTPLVNQTGGFILKLPDFLAPILDRFGPLPFTADLQRQLVIQATLLSANILTITASIVSNFIFILTTLVFTFYLLLDWENLRGRFVGLLSRRAQGRAEGLIREVEYRLGGWLRGQITLMFLVGLLTYLGLLALGVEYALPLALIAGLLEVIPVIGPIIAAIPALVVGFGMAPWMGIWVLVLYLVVQQFENSLLVPNVMGRAVGFSPLATLVFLFIGGQLFGLGGVILAIPVALFLSIFAKDFLSWSK